mgnify:CR=1 FL=1
MTVHCVTTMNKSYYNRIGKYMIYTWTKFAPTDYQLHLYLEDFVLPDYNDDRIKIEDWSQIKNLYDQWSINHYSDLKNEQGFTLKALTQIAMFRKTKNGNVLWLDADTIFIDKIPQNFFTDVILDYPLASWGDKTFESGTVWVNLSHKDWPAIEKNYTKIYLEDDKLPQGERWYDGEQLGRAVREAGIPINNLKSLCTKKTSTPLNYSWIGKYIRHLKAKAKKGSRLQDEMKYLSMTKTFEKLRDHNV